MSDSLKKMSYSLILSFLVSNLSDSLMIAHFLWGTWANRSWSLIFGERSEQIAHDRSFPLRDLCKWLMVAHFWWGIWMNRSQLLIWFERNEGNEQMSKWAMRKWASSQPWDLADNDLCSSFMEQISVLGQFSNLTILADSADWNPKMFRRHAI